MIYIYAQDTLLNRSPSALAAGEAGYIGSHMVRVLQTVGYRILNDRKFGLRSTRNRQRRLVESYMGDRAAKNRLFPKPCNTHDLKSAYPRYFHTTGAHPDGDIDEDRKSEST